MTESSSAAELLDQLFGPEEVICGVCERHGEWQKVVRQKQPVGRSCPHCAADEKAARDKREADEKAAAAERRRAADLAACGVSLRHIDKTFAAYVAETQEQANALARSKALAEAVLKDPRKVPSLILCGKPGTGKSHLACAITIAVYDGGGEAYRVSVADIIRELKDSWRSDSEKQETRLLNRYGKVTLLIIEEIGVQFGSDTERMYLFEIVNRRYENCLPTVLVSNLDPDKLAAEVGERVMDRLREDGGRMVRFTGESWRKK
jgi:DNA replication protein DnaC